MGILRYQTAFDEYFARLLQEKELDSEEIGQFCYRAVMSKDHPLANKKTITYEDLADYIEIAHGDPFVPYLPISDVKKAESTPLINKRIYVYERGSQFDLLADVPTTYMWVSPIPEPLLARNMLVERDCAQASRVYKDVLVFRRHHKFDDLESRFLRELKVAAKTTFKTGND